MVSGEHLGLKGAVEALVLALGLRMIGPAVGDPHAEPHQPDRERSVGPPASPHGGPLSIRIASGSP